MSSLINIYIKKGKINPSQQSNFILPPLHLSSLFNPKGNTENTDDRVHWTYVVNIFRNLGDILLI